jgi:hypothetical protein
MKHIAWWVVFVTGPALAGGGAGWPPHGIEPAPPAPVHGPGIHGDCDHKECKKDPVGIPEPETLMLLLTGLGGIALTWRRRK